jgi:hypothetical protein
MPEQSSLAEIFLAQDLSVVHSFYLFLLESSFGHEVPVPTSISHDTDVLHRFVLLLDRAVTPQMIRDGLHLEEHQQAAEALLRFFARKPQSVREFRDKADVLATALFRSLLRPDAGELTDAENAQVTLALEADLHRIYKNMPLPEPPNERMQLVREFEHLRAEIHAFRNFDELVDSGMMQKVRDIKQALDVSFLHPRVLSVVAAHNACFHEKFDALFIQAAKDVKTFAAQVQRDGGGMIPPLDTLAQEDMQGISRLKEALLHQRSAKATVITTLEREHPVALSMAAAAGASSSHSAPHLAEPTPSDLDGANTATAAPNRISPAAHVLPRSSTNTADVEAQALQHVQSTIRSFVRTADAHAAHVVPLPDGNITLTNAEADAFRADYGEEKSFRGQLAYVLMQMAALDARLMSQLQALETTRHTPYNWKEHADALAHLLSTGRNIVDQAMELAGVAKERGLHDKAAALAECIEKIRPRGQAAVEALQSIGSDNDAGRAAD